MRTFKALVEALGPVNEKALNHCRNITNRVQEIQELTNE